MPRKRKVCTNIPKEIINDQLEHKEIKKILQYVQINEAYHNKCIKRLQQVYEKMKHDDFTTVYIFCLKQLMQGTYNQYKDTGLKFMSKFVTSFQAEDMHPLFDSVLLWITQTVSLNANVRLRMCQFVNLMLNSMPKDAEMEEYHCNEILSYMFDRLKDVSSHVRVQAIKALYRLQVAEDPNDVVIKIFRFHLECDPSALVRQAVLTSLARNQHTIPCILDRLLDANDSVRRSAFLSMSSFPVKIYKTDQRLNLLEHGLTDCSEAVRNVVTKVMLPQWSSSYNMDFMALLSNIKPNVNEVDINRFRTVARLTLLAIFQSHEPSDLIAVLPLIKACPDELHNYQRCIQMDKLTIELSIFWLVLIEFFQNDDGKSNYLEQILPDLTTFCDYVEAFSVQINVMSVSQQILFTLLEIFHKFDLSDESGRKRLQNCVVHLLTYIPCNENQIISLTKISEKLITNSNDRLQFYVDISRDLINPVADLDENILAPISNVDANLEVEIASLKMKLFEFKEKETKYLEMKEYEKLAEISSEIDSCNEELRNLLAPLLPNNSICLVARRISTETTLKILQMIFHGVCSKTVRQLIPSICHLYKDFIRLRVESKNNNLRNWAIKCTATFSLLYGQFAKEAYHIISKQFFSHSVSSIWVTSIEAMFQLIDRYGFEWFLEDLPNSQSEQVEEPSTNTAQLTSGACISTNEFHDLTREHGEDLMLLFAHYLDSCNDIELTSALVDGFCRLILHGRFFTKVIMSKLIILFYNSETKPKIVQILSIFFETLIGQKQQRYLQSAMITTLTTIIEDNLEIDPQSVLNLIIHSDEGYHSTLAITLLEWMNQSSDTAPLRIITNEMLSLKITDDSTIHSNLMNLTDELLQKSLDKKTKNNLEIFKQKINGIAPIQFSSTQSAIGNEEDEMNFSNEKSDTDIESDENEIDTNENNNGNNKLNSKVNGVDSELSEIRSKNTLHNSAERVHSNSGQLDQVKNLRIILTDITSKSSLNSAHDQHVSFHTKC